MPRKLSQTSWKKIILYKIKKFNNLARKIQLKEENSKLDI